MEENEEGLCGGRNTGGNLWESRLLVGEQSLRRSDRFLYTDKRERRERGGCGGRNAKGT